MLFAAMTQTRIYKYDNIRLLLIFLVIIGHGMELFPTEKVNFLYRVIYSFHMPAFLFLTGKFARFDGHRIFRHLIIPYFVFQTIYLIFDAYVLQGTAVTLQYTTPYWILWFLLTVIFYNIIIPMLPAKNARNGIIVIASSVVISLLAGFDSSIGYYLSLSRTIVFAPFFLAGYYSEALFAGKKIRELEKGNPGLNEGICDSEECNHDLKEKTPELNADILKPAARMIGIIICIFIIGAGAVYVNRAGLAKQFLYGSFSYSELGTTFADRGAVYIIAAAWIYLLLRLVPDINIPGITVLGRNTMPVFLLHAFVIRLLAKYGVLHYSPEVDLVLMCVIAAGLIVLFGNRYFGKIFTKIF